MFCVSGPCAFNAIKGVMLNSRQQFGKESESLAVRTLKEKGYDILETNYVTKVGEIDIIAKEGKALVFVEVKARKNSRYGDPKYAVTPQKKKENFHVGPVLSEGNRPDEGKGTV